MAKLYIFLGDYIFSRENKVEKLVQKYKLPMQDPSNGTPKSLTRLNKTLRILVHFLANLRVMHIS